jgi:hypothetical protein
LTPKSKPERRSKRLSISTKAQSEVVSSSRRASGA